jgi:hypothetical protein
VASWFNVNVNLVALPALGSLEFRQPDAGALTGCSNVPLVIFLKHVAAIAQGLLERPVPFTEPLMMTLTALIEQAQEDG